MNGEKWIEHCSHNEHRLKLEVYSTSKFKCRVCNLDGHKRRYSCQQECNFQIHEICGLLPQSLTSFTHVEHSLSLRPRPFLLHRCRLCRGFVTSMVYRCEAKSCKFFLHPICSLIPEFPEIHPCHPPHPLKLHFLDDSNKLCNVCGEKCKNSRYHCEVCDVHIHVGCLLSNIPTTTNDSAITTSRGGTAWTHIRNMADVVQLLQATWDLISRFID